MQPNALGGAGLQGSTRTSRRVRSERCHVARTHVPMWAPPAPWLLAGRSTIARAADLASAIRSKCLMRRGKRADRQIALTGVSWHHSKTRGSHPALGGPVVPPCVPRGRKSASRVRRAMWRGPLGRSLPQSALNFVPSGRLAVPDRRDVPVAPLIARSTSILPLRPSTLCTGCRKSESRSKPLAADEARLGKIVA